MSRPPSINDSLSKLEQERFAKLIASVQLLFDSNGADELAWIALISKSLEIGTKLLGAQTAMEKVLFAVHHAARKVEEPF
jgi:hypothetical protein